MKKTIAVLVFLVNLVGLRADDASRTFRVAVHYSGPQAEKVLPALTTTLLRLGFPLRVVSSALPPDVSSPQRLQEAERLSLDADLDVGVVVQNGQWVVDWVFRSPFEPENKTRAQGKLTTQAPDWSRLAEVFWLFLLEPVQKVFTDTSDPLPYPPFVGRGTVRVYALPGTVVTGLGNPFTVDRSGVESVPVDIPGNYVVAGELAGHVTKTIPVFLAKNRMPVKLPQPEIGLFALDGDLFNLSFPAVSFQWNALPGMGFVRIGLDQFFAGVSFQNETDGSPSSGFVSEPLFVPHIGVGWYWSRPDGVRFYTAADFGVRYVYGDLRRFAVEPVFPVELQIFAGWEFPVVENGSIFFEIGPTLYFYTDKQEALASEPTNGPAYLDLTNWMLELPPGAKLGYRWFF